MRASLKFYVIGILILCISCSETSKSFDYGHIENNRYLNSFFDFTAAFPKGWVIVTNRERDSLSTFGRKLMDSTDGEQARLIKSSPETTVMLLAAYEQKLGTPTYFNAYLLITAENVTRIPEIKNGYDALIANRNLLERARMKFDHIDKDFKKIDINGQEFFAMNIIKDIGLFDATQTVFASVRDGYIICITIAYASDIQKEKLDEFIASIRWTRR